jgi:DNA polymerase III delta subunit
MNIIVLHGDDERKLYDRLSKFVETAKGRSWEVAYLDDRSQSIQEQLSSPSLFGGERFFIIRDVTRLGKKELEWINKNLGSLSGNLIIYHEGYIPQAIIKGLPENIKVEDFKLPVILWNFLDNLCPGNSEKSIKQLHQIIEKQAPEFVFTLVAKLFRDLFWVKTDEKSLPYPSWRVGKLKAQASKFSIDNIKLIINKLSEIDIKVKTSKADLTSELDLLVIKQLE